MPAAHLSASEAKRLGLDVPASSGRTTRHHASGPYHTICATCSEEFTTYASENRHVDATRHARYVLVLEEP